MSTTLPLFWDLSAASTTTRIDASVKLISALEHFQAQHVPKDIRTEEAETKRDGLDTLNAQDVSYSIRRLVRGLASPRESSRLGFAVALTELLSRINTVTCAQIVALILDSSKAQGSMTGQEERDVLFAQLFGFTSIIQSGLLLRDRPLPTSASSSTLASSLASYKDVLAQLLALGEKKSWLREGAWWATGLAIDALGRSNVSWKEEAVDATFNALFSESKTWTPEKVAMSLKLQRQYPSRDWRKLLSLTFKNPDLLSTANLSTLARILKEASADDDKESDLPKSGSWKPQVHFVWDMLLDEVLSEPASGRTAKVSLPEFFRIVVDESLFASTSSPERKYWGFQIFQKALPRVSAGVMPMLFTKNFMRSWINHLSNNDRYLHKAARQVATDIQAVVKKSPTLGFTLILQLTGVHGSRQFDKLTKTKTIESILTSMDNDGIQSYINYLLEQVNDEQSSQPADAQAVNARRAWIVDQLAALIRNGAIPKSDGWVQTILDWFAVHGLFLIAKKSEKSDITALHTVPSPPFSNELRKNCRDRLLSCLAELTGHQTVVIDGDKTSKIPSVASNGEFWIYRVLSTIEQLEKDTKHVSPLAEVDEEEHELRRKARQVAERLRAVLDNQREAAKGAELLLSATLLQQYCTDDEVDSDSLESCIDGASRMFPLETKKSKKKSKKSTDTQGETANGEALEPVDVLVDNVIGFLEKATAYMRAVANQVFSLLSGSVQESTVDLILTQLERREPAELMADEDEEMSNEEGWAEPGDEEDNDSSDEENQDDEDENEGEDLELRKKIEEALRVNGVDAASGDSDEESDEDLMDDEQMLAIDEQLAAAFRARASEKNLGKDVDVQREATHFKNRVLDLLDTYIKKQPSSPLIVRLIFPLVDLIVGTSSDERQLADKATGILRSRIGKSKDIPSVVDKDQVAQILEELHARAQKAPSSDVLAMFSQCSLYLSKMLHHAGEDAPILKAYKASLVDFMARKASKFNGGFFQDFVRRQTDVAWGLRDALIDVGQKAVNVYRQTQAFQILYSLINQLPAIGDRQAEILSFMPVLSRSLLEVISNACDSTSSYTPAQVKELLKLGIVAVRQTKRVASASEISAVWDPSAWTALADQLASSDRLKSSAGLQSMCKQITQLASDKPASPKGVDTTSDLSAAKRKASTLLEKEDIAEVQRKRKKVKKVKTSV